MTTHYRAEDEKIRFPAMSYTRALCRQQPLRALHTTRNKKAVTCRRCLLILEDMPQSEAEAKCDAIEYD